MKCMAPQCQGHVPYLANGEQYFQSASVLKVTVKLGIFFAQATFIKQRYIQNQSTQYLAYAWRIGPFGRYMHVYSCFVLCLIQFCSHWADFNTSSAQFMFSLRLGILPMFYLFEFHPTYGTAFSNSISTNGSFFLLRLIFLCQNHISQFEQHSVVCTNKEQGNGMKQ